PRYWANTTVHNGIWHVTLDVKQTKVAQPPPEVDIIMGKDVFIDVPGPDRVCHHCLSTVHVKKDCKTWQHLQSRPDALAAYEQRMEAQSRLNALRTEQARQFADQEKKRQQQRKQQHQQQQQEQLQLQQDTLQTRLERMSESEFIDYLEEGAGLFRAALR